MLTRPNLLRLTALASLLAGLILPVAAQAAPDANPCRRLWGTEDWTRRCAHLQPDFALEAYCRRVYGTDDWSRRCSQRYDDPASTCRRLWGTDEWTRRCVRDDLEICRRLWGTDEWTRRCVPHRPDPVRPDQVRPGAEHQVPEAVPVSPEAAAPLEAPAPQPVRPATRG
jgi:hypothetical protein